MRTFSALRAAAAARLRSEDVILAKGLVAMRPEGTVNDKLSTGEVELRLSIPRDPADRVVENNSVSAPLSVRREQLAVLIVESAPRWEYRYLEGVGQDVEIEFVDDTLTGEYRMTTNPWDKDALLLMPGGGMTDAESMGMANRVDRVRPLTNPMPWTNPLLIGYGRAKDQPFEKLALFTNLQRPPSIDFADFKRPEVLTNIRYELLP